jgi:hypothetical protein
MRFDPAAAAFVLKGFVVAASVPSPRWGTPWNRRRLQGPDAADRDAADASSKERTPISQISRFTSWNSTSGACPIWGFSSWCFIG